VKSVKIRAIRGWFWIFAFVSHEATKARISLTEDKKRDEEERVLQRGTA
jgi:hypothetical protein